MNESIANAMVFTEVNKPFEILKVKLPTLKNEECLVKIKYATICTSDLHTYHGRRNSPCPSVLGHEIIGEIIGLGNDNMVDHNNEVLTIGDIITWSVYAFDKDDLMAKQGIPQKSSSLYKYGHQKITNVDVLNGGFATHCHLKKGTAIFKLPQSLSFKEAAPLNCTHATIAGALRLAGNVKGKNVLVFGAGMLGISACAMANEFGAKHVFAKDLNKDRLEVAKLFGAEKCFDESIDYVNLKKQLNEYGDIGVIIDTTGVPDVMESGLDILGIGGVSIWVGAVYKAREVKFSAENIVRKLLTVKGLHNYTPEDLNTAIKFLVKSHKKYPFESLTGASFELHDLDDAFQLAQSGAHFRVGIEQ